MEYLVSMTTSVPDGTSEAAIGSTRCSRGRPIARTCGPRTLLRWRPPLQPGEWRTLGLFAADDETSSRRFSRPCRCGYGSPTRSRRFRRTRTTPHSFDAETGSPGAHEHLRWREVETRYGGDRIRRACNPTPRSAVR